MELQGGSNDDNTGLRVASFSCYLDTAKDNVLHKISPAPKDSTTSLANLRVDSFSYLNSTPPPEKFIFNLPPLIQLDPTPFTLPQQPRKKKDEITVFGADKYFSTKLDYKIGTNKPKEGPVNLARTRQNSVPRAPETSTRNTQTSFLQRNGSQAKEKKPRGKRIFPGFGCKGTCFNRKDVVLHINELETTSSYRGSNAPTRTKSDREGMEESRRSIEVFGSGTSVLRGGDVAKNLERKLSMLTWDAIPKVRTLPTSTAGSATSIVCDDLASEASSDLFEIENISGLMHPILREDVSMSPSSSRYAPSEASIQWSVVTADNYPPNSDYSEVIGGEREGRNGGILGCKSLRAVDVAHTNVSPKIHQNGKYQGKDFSFSLPNSHADLKNLKIHS